MKPDLFRDALRVQIRARIESSGLSQAEWGRRAGIGSGHLSGFLCGRESLSHKSMSRLLDLLGGTVTDDVVEWKVLPK